MRLPLSIHAVVTCYFMLAPITVDGRHSPPSDTTANFNRLGQSATIIVSLSLLLPPVAVYAGYEDCKPPNGIKQKDNVFELTPTKEGVNALFSVGSDKPLVVRTAEKFQEGAVVVRVSDDDCYSTVVAGLFGKSFTVQRSCPPSEDPVFGPHSFSKRLVVTFKAGSVEYAAGNTEGKLDDWDKFEPCGEDEEGRDLWNLTFTMPSGSSQPLTLYMNVDEVKIKCSFTDTTTASTTTGNSTDNGNATFSPGSGGGGKEKIPADGGSGETRIAGLLAWKFVVILASVIILLLLLVIAGIVIAFVCIHRKMRQRIAVLNARGDDKPQKSEKEAKPAERTKEPTDLERSEKSKNRNAGTAEPPRNFKTMYQMRREWFKDYDKTSSFKEQFYKSEVDHVRKYPERYQWPLWDRMHLPEDRDDLYWANCAAVELWEMGGRPDDTQPDYTYLPLPGLPFSQERTASAKSAEPVKSTKSAKKANGTTKNALETPKKHVSSI
ncbi:hypothetical protein AAVH_12718 [Aphelenchoides avenae]|nr:hypothetical protein AAVH_12718 [Aphelenchus avenae]